MTNESIIKKSALLIIDMQIGVVSNAYKLETVVTNINHLIAQARSKEIPIIWIQHFDQQMQPNSDPWHFIPDLHRSASDLVISKTHGDAFESTNLKNNLDALEINHLFIVGAQTDACIRATLHGAFVRGYETILVSDAHTTEDLTNYGLPSPEHLIHFTNTYWTWQTANDRQGLVLKTEAVKF